MSSIYANIISEVGLQIFIVMKIQVVVFWVMILCSDLVGHQSFGGPCSLHLHSEVNALRKGA